LNLLATYLFAATYLAIGRWLVRARFSGRTAAFAILNLAAVYSFFFWNGEMGSTVQFLFYVALILIQYIALSWWSETSRPIVWIAFFVPIFFLAFFRVVPANAIGHVLMWVPAFRTEGHLLIVSSMFVGMSYMAFRTSYLVLEVRNRVVPLPDIWEYLGFAFFLPTFSVGPISRYSVHSKPFREEDSTDAPISRALIRVLVGAAKFRFFGPILNQLTYSGLLLDGYKHPWVDLPIAAVAYYLYLYCNFSGFCDIAIGSAGLMGVMVEENFSSPFAARNIKDFWNRWHITLSSYMRDVVFAPLSKHLVGKVGPKYANHAIAASILVLFLLVGIWHGKSWNFAAFGLAHGIGVAANHYYTIALKRTLGRDRFRRYNDSRFIRAIAVTATFVYVSATLFLFVNDWINMKAIFASLSER
jgi:D-alanyl-lipoteichoic acid acyltransferase DltB (MBOAT superfamily)